MLYIQGVTYCGESKASNITMANIPWHEEVIHVYYHMDMYYNI